MNDRVISGIDAGGREQFWEINSARIALEQEVELLAPKGRLPGFQLFGWKSARRAVYEALQEKLRETSATHQELQSRFAGWLEAECAALVTMTECGESARAYKERELERPQVPSHITSMAKQAAELSRVAEKERSALRELKAHRRAGPYVQSVDATSFFRAFNDGRVS